MTDKSAAQANLPTNSSILSSTAVHTVSAAGAGAIATLATHPFDVIKVSLSPSPVSVKPPYDDSSRRKSKSAEKTGTKACFGR